MFKIPWPMSPAECFPLAQRWAMRAVSVSGFSASFWS
uniref:Uncharacterized protein n=1 Tax=Anguilla anguilla TaxID=7936 RepID=A0A0E9T138_ANGAN